jgi:hypothetical protein
MFNDRLLQEKTISDLCNVISEAWLALQKQFIFGANEHQGQ